MFAYTERLERVDFGRPSQKRSAECYGTVVPFVCL